MEYEARNIELASVDPEVRMLRSISAGCGCVFLTPECLRVPGRSKRLFLTGMRNILLTGTCSSSLLFLPLFLNCLSCLASLFSIDLRLGKLILFFDDEGVADFCILHLVI